MFNKIGINPNCYVHNGQAWFGIIPPQCICNPKKEKWIDWTTIDWNKSSLEFMPISEDPDIKDLKERVAKLEKLVKKLCKNVKKPRS